MVLAPCGPLFEGGDVPQRETAGEVDDSQQGTIGAQTHAKHTVLDNTNARIFFNEENFVQTDRKSRITVSSPCLEKSLKLGILKKPLF